LTFKFMKGAFDRADPTPVCHRHWDSARLTGPANAVENVMAGEALQEDDGPNLSDPEALDHGVGGSRAVVVDFMPLDIEREAFAN
jgi:hypothetical protein